MRTSLRLCLLALVLAAVGCARDFGPPKPFEAPNKPNNAACTTAGECASNACQDGFCCNRVCGENEHCNLPGTGGTCTFNPAGTTPCDAGSQCAPTGACQQGLCCEHACRSYERCDLLGSEGHCVQVPLTTPCDAGSQCPGACVGGKCCDRDCATYEFCDPFGHCQPNPLASPCDAGSQCAPPGACVDGVCCERACDACQVCTAYGHCQDTADNTDPHGDCLPDGGACLACFRGVCAPALRGTDPHGACGLDHACGDAPQCYTVDGGGCTSDVECLGGTCLNGRCLTVEFGPFLTGQMNPDATERNQPSLATSEYGATALSFHEIETSTTHSGLPFETENSLMAGVRAAGGEWHVALAENLIDAEPDLFESAVVFRGEQAVVLIADAATTCGPGARQHTCALQGRTLSPSAQPGPLVDVMPEPAFPDGGRFAHGDDSHFLAVVPQTSVVVQVRGKLVRFLEPSGEGWRATYRPLPGPDDHSIYKAQALRFGGEPALLALTYPGSIFAGFNGLVLVTPSRTLELPFDFITCDPSYRVTELAAYARGDTLVVATSCSDEDPRLKVLDVTVQPDGGVTSAPEELGGFADYHWDYVLPLSDSPSLTLGFVQSTHHVFNATEAWLFGEGMTQGRLVGLSVAKLGDGEEHVRQLAAVPDRDGLPRVLFNVQDLTSEITDRQKLFLLSVHR